MQNSTKKKETAMYILTTNKYEILSLYVHIVIKYMQKYNLGVFENSVIQITNQLIRKSSIQNWRGWNKQLA
jgi:hypothetical protein